MKAFCIARFCFVHSSEEIFSLEVSGEISLPQIIQPPLKVPNVSDFGTGFIESYENDDLFTIDSIGYRVAKGVWKPIMIISPHIGNIKAFGLPWSALKMDIDETFLPGYEFCWDGHGKKPTDWVPLGFEKLFNRETI